MSSKGLTMWQIAAMAYVMMVAWFVVYYVMGIPLWVVLVGAAVAFPVAVFSAWLAVRLGRALRPRTSRDRPNGV